VFIQKKHWSLVEDQDIEYEQYDRVHDSHYVIAHDNNEILGGARLMRCDAKMAHGSTPYTYMIKDAADGLIDMFCRMARRMNYTLERTGPVCGDETGRYLVMKFDLSQYKTTTSEG